VSHYAVPVKPPAVIPVPAATLVLLRDRAAGGFEILLMQRHAKSKFAAGDYVFPGGKLTADDNPPDAIRWCAGLNPEVAAKTLALEDAQLALAHWIGVIRETFEEVGVLLATAADGGPARIAPATLTECRRACQADNRAFWQLVKGEDLRLATDRLVYFAHWITPEGQPLRFDTRFFAAPMPRIKRRRATARRSPTSAGLRRPRRSTPEARRHLAAQPDDPQSDAVHRGDLDRGRAVAAARAHGEHDRAARDFPARRDAPHPDAGGSGVLARTST